MGTTPSGVDITHQEKILDQLEDSMFYIFMIWNKRGDKTIKIYDLEKNILFDTTDVTVQIQDNEFGLSVFLEDAKKLVQDKKPAVQTAAASYQNNIVYGGSYSSYAQNSSSYSSKTSTEKKHKGRRKDSTTSLSKVYGQQTIPYEEDDEEDDYLSQWYTK